MENILKQLFYGNYTAFQELTAFKETEKPAQHRRGEISMQLKSQVSDEQFNLIVQLMDCMDRSQTENMERAFVMGVRLGAQFVIAACTRHETEVKE